jgi:hypothetical protein
LPVTNVCHLRCTSISKLISHQCQTNFSDLNSFKTSVYRAPHALLNFKFPTSRDTGCHCANSQIWTVISLPKLYNAYTTIWYTTTNWDGFIPPQHKQFLIFLHLTRTDNSLYHIILAICTNWRKTHCDIVLEFQFHQTTIWDDTIFTPANRI